MVVKNEKLKSIIDALNNEYFVVNGDIYNYVDVSRTTDLDGNQIVVFIFMDNNEQVTRFAFDIHENTKPQQIIDQIYGILYQRG